MTQVQNATDETFAAILGKHRGRSVVDFHADWCGPCQRMHAIFDQFANSEPDVAVIKVDVEACPGTAARYGIRALPSFALYENGVLVDVRSGLMSQAELTRWAVGK